MYNQPLKELPTVDRPIERPQKQHKSKFIPTTRNQTIKMMTECPASTPQRIVFLPNMNGVGFQCKLRVDETPVHVLNDDEKMVMALPMNIRQEVVEGVRSLNHVCYEIWREIKYQRERYPLDKENLMLKVAVLVSLFCLVFFFVFYESPEVSTWFLQVCFAMLLGCYAILIGIAIVVCIKQNPIENFDSKIFDCIKEQLKALNERSKNGLVWRNPKGHMWIYVTIPESVTPR